MKTMVMVMAAALTMATTLASHVTLAQQAGIKRTDLQRHDLSIPAREVVQVRALKAGEVLFTPAGTVHAARNVGSVNAAEPATYIVDKGKPLLTLVKWDRAL